MIHIEGMTGIVVEVEKDTVLVLTSDGELLDVETNGKKYEVGEEIRFNKLIETKKVIHWNRVLSHTSGLVAAVLLFFTGAPLLDGGNIGNAYAASIYVDSTSDVQVTINQDKKVINTIPIDQNAKKILKDINWRYKPVNNFISDFLSLEKKHGYLNKNDKSIIAVLPSKNVIAKKLPIEKDISNDEDLKNDVLTVTVPANVVQKAESLGVTPGKFAFFLAAKDQGRDIPINVLKTSNITELINSDVKIAEALPKYSPDELAALANSNMAVASAPVQSDPAPKPSSNPEPKPTAPATTTATPTQKTTQPTTTTQTSTTQQTPANSTKQDNKQDTKQDNNTNTNDIKPADNTKPTDDTNNKPVDNTPPKDDTKPVDNGTQPKDPVTPVTPPLKNDTPPVDNTTTPVPSAPVTPPPADNTTPADPVVTNPAPPPAPVTPPPTEQPGQTGQPAQPCLIECLLP